METINLLELIKIGRILITTIHITEDVVEYDELGLAMKFRLNPDYVYVEGSESEFDALPDPKEEENDKEND